MNTGEAVVEAAATRLRPIMLTSLTTIAGLLPTGARSWRKVGRMGTYGNYHCFRSDFFDCNSSSVYTIILRFPVRPEKENKNENKLIILFMILGAGSSVYGSDFNDLIDAALASDNKLKQHSHHTVRLSRGSGRNTVYSSRPVITTDSNNPLYNYSLGEDYYSYPVERKTKAYCRCRTCSGYASSRRRDCLI